jgi:predicted Zn-ribbon and HTH transcriptional regulator
MASDLTMIQPTSTSLPEIKDNIEKMLLLLSTKERSVIEKRFSLNKSKKYTLEEIGKDFGVTRERIRQIERNALQKLKRNIQNFTAYTVNSIGYQFLIENGGIISEDKMLSRVMSQMKRGNISEILLILSLDSKFDRLTNTILCKPYFKLKEIKKEQIDSIADLAEDILAKKKHMMDITEIMPLIEEAGSYLPELNEKMLMSIFDIYKKTKLIDDKVGLMAWRDINPRTLRDKIYYVLRKQDKPTHFAEIANLIVNENFDKKTANMQAIHNELIRYDEFILIGRGIYALKEWGYEKGTVADIITQVLQKNESLSEERIIKEVLKKRQVKPITVILNLKNKPQFTRIGRKQYTLK